MAKMIPAEISTENRFERDLFEKFKKLPAKWTIFHSVSVETGNRQPRELDYVILIPESYSVVYLEAKGGSYSIRDRQWFRRGDEPVDPSPTQQASSGMFALQNQFVAQHPQYNKPSLWLSFSCAVAFTDWDISGEATRQGVTRGALLMGGGDVQNGNRMTQLLREHTNQVRNNFDRTEGWNNRKRIFAAGQLKDMEAMLNPPTETLVTSNIFFRHNLDTLLPELLEPTHSQTAALILIKGIDRCVIDGAAGTGKTALAMESVRQRCEQDGDTVAILCSNPLLSKPF